MSAYNNGHEDGRRKPIKVVFAVMNPQDWTGGLIYQKNLYTALHNYAKNMETYFFTWNMQGFVPAGMQADDHYHFIGYPRTYGFITRGINHVLGRVTGKNLLLHGVYHTSVPGSADVTFNLPPTYRKSFIAGKRVASLFWIPDFQHVRCPEYFTTDELKSRDVNYRQFANQATLMILSSNDALKDFKVFSPENGHKGRVMHFVAYVDPSIYEQDPIAVATKYKLTEKFFYLPNQFWAHKNHIVVFEALKKLADRGIDAHIVCTGIQNDRRNPAYFPGLTAKIEEWGLKDRISFLGIIPHEDVYMLYRQAIAIINPSLFEGWSTSVEESKSIGKRILLSDIPVHREQCPAEAVYFDPHDPAALSEKMEHCWTAYKPGPDLIMEARARKELPARMQSYGETFEKIATEARDMANGKRLLKE